MIAELRQIAQRTQLRLVGDALGAAALMVMLYAALHLPGTS